MALVLTNPVLGDVWITPSMHRSHFKICSQNQVLSNWAFPDQPVHVHAQAGPEIPSLHTPSDTFLSHHCKYDNTKGFTSRVYHYQN